jgi:Uma2 family endonuclease
MTPIYTHLSNKTPIYTHILAATRQPQPRLAPLPHSSRELGASLAHNLIVGNLLRHLGNALEGSTCEALPSDMRVRVSAKRYSYPDVTIVCGPPSLEGESDVLLNPSVIIEVLSPSTAAFDEDVDLAA